MQHPDAGPAQTTSALDQLIPPEIKGDPFYALIQQISRHEAIDTVLELGSSSGAGSTEAFVTGLRDNPRRPQLYCMEVSRARFEALRGRYAGEGFVHCYNASSVPPSRFVTEAQVAEFHCSAVTKLSAYPLEQVLGWLRQDIAYVRDAGVPEDGIELIRRTSGIDAFDAVLIDGSEFSGSAELDVVYGAKFILLDDIDGLKNYETLHRLLADPRYRLIALRMDVRNGYAAFVRADWPVGSYETIRDAVEALPGSLTPREGRLLFGKVKSLPERAAILDLSTDGPRAAVVMGFACAGSERRVYSRGFGSQEPADVARLRLGDVVTALPADWKPSAWADRPVQLAVVDRSRAVDVNAAYALLPAGAWLAVRGAAEEPVPSLSHLANVGTIVCGQKASADAATDERLPVHFFTIVLNGEPFIRHHVEAFKSLPFAWHWHVIEGVADLHHDTGWSLAAGGRVPLELQREGLSTDGTTAYLDELARQYPDHVTVYRKPPGGRWDGKREMVSAPLANIGGECLLWQVDADELWTTEQVAAAREMFLADPAKTAARYWCWYFVGPELITATRFTYGNRDTEWLRTWRYRPRMAWAAHEPPTLAEPVGDGWRDVASIDCFTQEQTEERGLVFQHYAYATEAQVAFKESYYGYTGAVARWRALQLAGPPPVLLRDYFPWVTDETAVDRAGDYVARRLIALPPVTPSALELTPSTVLYLRTDSIGDNVLAASMLPHVAARFPEARLVVVCQASAAPLYEPSPLVAEVIAYDRAKAYADEAYRQDLVRRVQAVGADLTLCTVFSREPLTDLLALQSRARQIIGLRGDATNALPQNWAEANARFTALVESPGNWVPEISRHADLLRGIGVHGVDATELHPQLWTDAADAEFADRLFREHGLEPGKIIALFGGAQFAVRVYQHFGKAVAAVARERGWKVVALGTAAESAVNATNLTDAGVPGVDLCGKLTLRQTAEVLRRCALAVGSETGLAHVACAVDTPNVILLGGGHFGRFMPYSPLTTVACLPIECYGCNWNCRYRRPHCVKDVAPAVIEAAVRHALAGPQARPAVFAQDRSMWSPAAGEPQWAWFHSQLDRHSIDLFACASAQGGDDVRVTPLRWPARYRPPLASVAERHPMAAERRRLALLCFQSTLERDDPAVQGSPAAALVQTWRAESCEIPAEAGDAHLLDEILSGLARGPADPFYARYALAAPLYFRPYELTSALDPWQVPPAWSDAVTRAALASPVIFDASGEEEAYAAYLAEWLTRLHASLDRRGDDSDARSRAILHAAAESLNVIGAYFARGDLTDPMRLRARTIERAERSWGLQLDHTFGDRPAARRKVRLGVLQLQFAFHTETYSTLPNYEHLDRDRFEIILYAVHRNGTEIETYCRSRADRFTVLPRELPAQAAALRADDLDVLFIGTNVAAVTHPLTLLAAHRLARAQITSLNSPVTTGFAAMDAYVIGRGARDPAGVAAAYTERPVFVDGPGFCISRPHRPPPSGAVVTRDTLGLPADATVFISGANFYKIGPAARRAWARVLAGTPGAYLVLFPFGPSWSNAYAGQALVRDLNAELAAVGVATDRVKLAGTLPSEADVLRLLAIADVYLDSFPYAGAVSLSEAMEVGLPPVAMHGEPQRFGQASAALRDAGMGDCVARDEDEYVRLAVELGVSASKRKEVVARVRATMAGKPRFVDSEWYAKQVEKVFLELAVMNVAPASV